MAKKRLWRDQLNAEFQEHYQAITEKPNLYIEAERVENGFYLLTMTNLVALFTFEKFNFNEWFQLNVIQRSPRIDAEPLIRYQGSSAPPVVTSPSPSLPEDIDSCLPPAVFMSEKHEIISGLTSVLRFILKYTICKSTISGDPLREVLENLLGFRGGCLAACAETSTWTTFCEVEMTQGMILSLLTTICNCQTTSEIEIPEDIVRFEYHLAQPVRIHNFSKEIQHRVAGPESESSSGEPPRKNPNPGKIYDLRHDYAEGPDATLSDVILFPSVHLAIQTFGEDIFTLHFPRVVKWYQRLQKFLDITSLDIGFPNSGHRVSINDEDSVMLPMKTPNFKVKIPDIPHTSLYKSDPLRDKWKMRAYTKQDDVEEAVNFLQGKGIEPLESILEMEVGVDLLDWDKVPHLIHPVGGNLPESRRTRKGHQLGSLLNMVEFAYHEKVDADRINPSPGSNTPGAPRVKIVDFCSGGGHLGILVAWRLPNAHVILVENKEESLRRAQARIQKIGLRNITFFQCNLTSYTGRFDIGMALHACGSATDLVLKKCEQSGASFVVSPCCYGSIQNSHFAQYPRSGRFIRCGFSHRQYLVLAHSSDQTHDAGNAKTGQGYLCMRIIDTDRLAYFEELQYRIWLTRMIPETASPKNHILVGIPPQSPPHNK